MSVFLRLAQLRPGMPVSKLYEATGRQWKVPANGKMRVMGSFSARIDLSGQIGSVRFNAGFPVRIPVLGYHVGMSFQQAASLRPVVSLGWNAYKTPESFRADSGTTDEVILYVDKENILHSFEIMRPGAVYGEDRNKLFGDSSIVISYVDYDDTRSMLTDWILNNASLNEDEDSEPIERYARWLSEVATPDEWHFAAGAWDVEEKGWVPTFWIIRQPQCEIATALETFYRCLDPTRLGALLGNSQVEGNQEDIKLTREIRARLLAGFYSRRSIAFDGEAAVTKCFGKQARSREVVAAIPPFMRQSFGTRTPPDLAGPWIEGFPDVLWRGRE